MGPPPPLRGPGLGHPPAKNAGVTVPGYGPWTTGTSTEAGSHADTPQVTRRNKGRARHSRTALARTRLPGGATMPRVGITSRSTHSASAFDQRPKTRPRAPTGTPAPEATTSNPAPGRVNSRAGFARTAATGSEAPNQSAEAGVVRCSISPVPEEFGDSGVAVFLSVPKYKSRGRPFGPPLGTPPRDPDPGLEGAVLLSGALPVRAAGWAPPSVQALSRPVAP